MRIKLFILSLSGLLISCENLSLVENNIKYSELPVEVKKHVFNSEFCDLNTPVEYKIESKKHLIFPWIYNTNLVRVKDNRSYDIDFKKEYNSESLIIHENNLYIVNHYNVYISDSLNYSFSKYKLN